MANHICTVYDTEIIKVKAVYAKIIPMFHTYIESKNISARILFVNFIKYLTNMSWHRKPGKRSCVSLKI